MEVFQKGWEDVTLKEYIDLIEINKNNKGMFSKALETLCYLTDSDHWEELESFDILKEYHSIIWVDTHPIGEKLNIIGEYKLKPFDKLSLAEWIDLDNSIINSEYSNIINLLYRKYEEDKWGNIKYEPYEFSLKDRIDISENYPITSVIRVIEDAYKYRDNLLNSFTELFEGYDDESLTEDEKEMLSPSEVIEIENQIKQDNLKKNFAWQHLLDDISGGVWSHIPTILELPHTFVFNMRLAKKIFYG